jgi:hypothetical protein
MSSSTFWLYPSHAIDTIVIPEEWIQSPSISYIGSIPEEWIRPPSIAWINPSNPSNDILERPSKRVKFSKVESITREFIIEDDEDRSAVDSIELSRSDICELNIYRFDMNNNNPQLHPDINGFYWHGV